MIWCSPVCIRIWWLYLKRKVHIRELSFTVIITVNTIFSPFYSEYFLLSTLCAHLGFLFMRPKLKAQNNQIGAFFFFFSHHAAYRVLIFQTGIEPCFTGPWQWKLRVLTTGPPGNSLGHFSISISESQHVEIIFLAIFLLGTKTETKHNCLGSQGFSYCSIDPENISHAYLQISPDSGSNQF